MEVVEVEVLIFGGSDGIFGASDVFMMQVNVFIGVNRKLQNSHIEESQDFKSHLGSMDKFMSSINGGWEEVNEGDISLNALLDGVGGKGVYDEDCGDGDPGEEDVCD